MGCFAVAAGKEASENNRVIVGHNEDDFGRYAVMHGFIQARDWNLHRSEEAFLPAEEGRAKIPQVPHTNAFYWVEYSDEKRGSSVADSFYNEFGVFVTSDSALSSKPDMDDPLLLKDNGIEYNLRRAIAERAHSARHGTEIALQLLAEWGYAPGGRMYTIADKEEAWNVQAAHGRYYAAVRIPDDAVMILPNHFTVHALNKFPCSIALDKAQPKIPEKADFSKGAILFPADLIENAINHGWYQPSQLGNYSDFDFAFVYQEKGDWKSDVNTLRQDRGMHLILGENWRKLVGSDPFAAVHGDSNPMFYPFCVYPERKIDISVVHQILTSHMEDNSEKDGGKDHVWSSHDPSFGRTICCYSTCESNIVVFEDDPRLTTIWTAPGRGCQLPYIPLHPLNGIPEEFDQMPDPVLQLQRHLTCQPGINCFKDSGWSSFQKSMYLVDLQTDPISLRLSKMLNVFLSDAMMKNNEVIQQAYWLIAAGKDFKSLIAQFDQTITGTALRRMIDFGEENLNLIDISVPNPISRSKAAESIYLEFSLPAGQKPLAESIFFGQGNAQYTGTSVNSVDGSLEQISDTEWKINFSSKDFLVCVFSQGCYDYYFKIKTEAKVFFYGFVLMEFIA